MKTLKGYVRNRAQPEGCVAERYLAKEFVQFCSKYFKWALQVGVRRPRNDEVDKDVVSEGRLMFAGKSINLSPDRLRVALQYVLFNFDEVQPYIQSNFL
ncbi:hypothetical protein Scep_024364 [Stephania cephalantha]|uniref:DUF4218 domain-containing protein n=1 Tax=Stephania cephalantha TaxID=152367 RepID=A0AAP0HYD1_9MAGN